MNPRRAIIATSIATLLAMAPAVPGHATPQFKGPTVAEQFLLAAANLDRAARGLQQLHYNPILSEAARYHAREMAAHGDISHQFPGEPELSERGAKAGAHFSIITENVAEAPDASQLHDLWMHSPGHRANLLDPQVDSVGISVVYRNHEAFAVEDFANTVESLSYNQQESTVSNLLTQSGLRIADPNLVTQEEARKTCLMSTGYAAHRQPWFVMRYTADRLTELPTELQHRLQSGRYHQAVVGACTDPDSTGPFTGYNIAVLLYP
jgi:Cysteine-rich secretory protein family